MDTTQLKDMLNVLENEFFLFKMDGTIVTLIHKETNIPFQLILNGEFIMGFSSEEEQAAKILCNPLPFDAQNLRPTHLVKLNPFLISQTPLTNYQLQNLFPTWKYHVGNEHSPANVDFELIQKIQKITEMRIPFEEEWEYACRGFTKSLFVFGDKLPNEKELYQWLSCDFSDLNKLKANAFGLYGLFAGEWCGNNYKENYVSTIQSVWKTIRGGGSLFYPWQDEEWIWCMSSMRMSSEDLGENGTAAFRLVRELGCK